MRKYFVGYERTCEGERERERERERGDRKVRVSQESMKRRKHFLGRQWKRGRKWGGKCRYERKGEKKVE